jgi:NADH-quinone oxidoreductase subunit J
MSTVLFIIFAGLAIGCAIAMVSQSNPLYSAISLIGVFISLASIYVTLAAPFIAAVQVIVYAGAIMVLVIFVIMLLNVEHSGLRRRRLKFLLPLAIGLAGVLIAETAFFLYSMPAAPVNSPGNISNVGLTSSIGHGLFTGYLLPFEVTSILLLMAIVGAMDIVYPRAVGDLHAVETDSTDAAAQLLGVEFQSDPEKRE